MAAPPSVGTITPSSGISAPEEWVTFTTTYTDPDGWQNLKAVRFLVNTSLTSVHGASLVYKRTLNQFYLYNDEATALLGGIPPGTPTILENSQVRLDCARTSVTGSGNTLTIRWVVSFKPPFSGKTHNLYLWAKDGPASTTGWLQNGTWAVNRSPEVGTPEPSEGIVSPNQWVSITATYRDRDGHENLQAVRFLLNTELTSVHGASLLYNQNEKKLYLHNDEGVVQFLVERDSEQPFGFIVTPPVLTPAAWPARPGFFRPLPE